MADDTGVPPLPGARPEPPLPDPGTPSTAPPTSEADPPPAVRLQVAAVA